MNKNLEKLVFRNVSEGTFFYMLLYLLKKYTACRNGLVHSNFTSGTKNINICNCRNFMDSIFKNYAILFNLFKKEIRFEYFRNSAVLSLTCFLKRSKKLTDHLILFTILNNLISHVF